MHENEFSKLQTVVADLRQQVVLLASQVAAATATDKSADATEDAARQQQQLIDQLVSQAAFVTAASLNERLEELRNHLEEAIGGVEERRAATAVTSIPLGEVDDQQTLKLNKFAKTLGEFRALVASQKTDLEARVSVYAGQIGFWIRGRWCGFVVFFREGCLVSFGLLRVISIFLELIIIVIGHLSDSTLLLEQEALFNDKLTGFEAVSPGNVTLLLAQLFKLPWDRVLGD